MQKITADKILLPEGLVENIIVILDHNLRILDIDHAENYNSSEVKKYNGVLTPGLINCHCHLELSHLKDKIPTKTGLVEFVKNIVGMREVEIEQIKSAAQDANSEMVSNGIVAVGDISNVDHTLSIKKESSIYYHTFIECFDLLQSESAESSVANGRKVRNNFLENGLIACLVPHAPYSVSQDLFNKLLAESADILSIHMQETEAEDEIIKSATGPMADLFTQFGVDLSSFSPIGKQSPYYALPKMDDRAHWLLVHNTLSQKSTIDFAHSLNKNTFWVTCPNANLYIEDKLPDYKSLIENNATLCLGTDSLASNAQLSILEEIKTIRKNCPYISFEELLKWATINGAKALKIDDKYGSIEIGKTPGLNIIDGYKITSIA